MAQVFVSDLSAKTDEASLSQFFRGVQSVKLHKDRKGRSLRNARITFTSPEFQQEALDQNGAALHGRPLIVSLLVHGRVTPLYLMARKLPRIATHAQVSHHFNFVAQSHFVVHLPLNDDETNKSYCFIYFSSYEDYVAGLTLDNSELLDKQISLEPGLYMGGRGRRCVDL